MTAALGHHHTCPYAALAPSCWNRPRGRAERALLLSRPVASPDRGGAGSWWGCRGQLSWALPDGIRPTALPCSEGPLPHPSFLWPWMPFEESGVLGPGVLHLCPGLSTPYPGAQAPLRVGMRPPAAFSQARAAGPCPFNPIPTHTGHSPDPGTRVPRLLGRAV